MAFHADNPFPLDHDALAFEQSPLKPPVRFGNRNSSSGPYDPVPGDALATGARRHRIANRACSAGQHKRPREFSIGCHAAARDFLH